MTTNEKPQQPRLPTGQFGPLPKPPPERMKLVAWRVPQETIDRVKRAAYPFNMPYQAFMRLLVEQGLQYIDEHGALDVKAKTADAKALEAHRRAAFVAQYKAENNIPDDPPPPRKRKSRAKKVPSEGATPVDTASEEELAERGVQLLFEEAEHHPNGFAVGNLDPVPDPDEPTSGPIDQPDFDIIEVSADPSPEEVAAGVSTEALEQAARDVDTITSPVSTPSVAQQIMAGLNVSTPTTPAPPPSVDTEDFGPVEHAPGYEPPPLTPEDIEEREEAIEQARIDYVKDKEDVQEPSGEARPILFVPRGVLVEVLDPSDPQPEEEPIDPDAPYFIEPSVMESRSRPSQPLPPPPDDDDEFAKLMESIPEPKRDTEVPPPEASEPESEETRATPPTTDELQALLEGDSSLDAQPTFVAPKDEPSEEDDILDVLNQFDSSAAQRVAASADDDEPHSTIDNSQGATPEDFESILGSL